MGHQVEYLVDLPAPRARAWLSSLPGRWDEPAFPEALPHHVSEWGGKCLFADIGPAAFEVSVPAIKYSWLIAEHTPSVEWVGRFEDWLARALPGVRAVRVDELLWGEWPSESGREWHQWPDPVRALRDWLLGRGEDARHFRLLPDEQAHAEPGPAPDPARR